MEIVEKRNIIKEILKKNSVKSLEDCITDNNISLKELNDTTFNVLIYSIEQNTSVDVIKYIIDQCQFKAFNFYIIERNQNKIPLFCAIANNRFRIADVLLEYKANINCTINNNNIISYLWKNNCLNGKNLQYILNHGFNIQFFIFKISNLINEMIENKKNEFLNIIFKNFIFDQLFIINFLKIYKNKETLTDKELKSILYREKNKISVNENMYKKANDKGNYKAMKILFDHDGSDQDIVFCRINKYDILEKAVKMNNYSFVKNILSYKTFGFKNILSESLLIEANKNGNIDIMKLLIKEALKSVAKSVKKR